MTTSSSFSLCILCLFLFLNRLESYAIGYTSPRSVRRLAASTQRGLHSRYAHCATGKMAPLLATSSSEDNDKNQFVKKNVFFRFLKNRVANIMAIAAFFFLSIDSSFAAKRAVVADNGVTTTIDKPTKVKRKGKRKGKKRSAVTKAGVAQAPAAPTSSPASAQTSSMRLPIRVKLPEVDGALLTKVGYGAAVASIILAVISDDGKKASKKRRRPTGRESSASYTKPVALKDGKGGKGLKLVTEEEEEEEEEGDDSGGYTPKTFSLDNKGRSAPGKPARSSALPPAEEILGGDIDDFFEPPVSSKKPATRSTKEQQEEEEDELFDTPSSKPTPAAKKSMRDVEAERLENKKSAMERFNAEAAKAEQAKAEQAKAEQEKAEQEKEEEEERVEEKEQEQASVQSPAQKKGIFDRIFAKPGGNRNTDIHQVLALKDDAQRFRKEVSRSLSSSVDSEAFGDLLGVDADANMDDEARVRALLDAKESCGLSLQQAGDSFADVASAMLVILVDAAAATLDAGDEAGTALRLDAVADFVQGAGAVFGKVAAGASIEPVLYNGPVKRGRLETLYFTYLKSTMSADNMMAMFGGADEEKSEGEGVEEAVDRTSRLPSIQQVFSIKENKRSSLEQKALRENLMSLAGGLGGGDGGGLGGIMEALSGKGGGGIPDMAGLEEMMKGMDPEALRGAAGLPDNMDNMNPEEMAAMSKDAMSSVKAALQDGSITKSDIAELEKAMGLDITQVVKMMDAGNIDKAKLKEMGPEFSEMLAIFKQLAGLKKSL